MVKRSFSLRRWLLCLAAAAAVFVGLSFLAGEEGVDSGAWWLGGGWYGLVLRIVTTLLVAHGVFWWGDREPGNLSAAGFGGLAGVLVCFLVFDVRIADPRLTGWAAEMAGAEEMSMEAWEAFREAPWRLPVETSSEPGLLVGGAVPGVAMLAKVLSGSLPDVFQYVGFWLCLCFCLQGAMAGLLMRCLTLDARLQMLGTAMFLVTPVLFQSAAYPAAMAHWLIVTALYLYFRTVAQNGQGRLWVAWVGLVVVSVMVQGQLAVMITLLALTFVVRCVWIDRSIGWGRAVLEIAMILLALGVAGYVLGYADASAYVGHLAAADTGRYGSMNFAAPWDPAGWSALLRSWIMPAAQSGLGFAYVGAGVILLVFWCWLMVVMRPMDSTGFRPWAPLLGASVLLTLLAVVPRVAIGQYVLVDLAALFEWPVEGGVLAASGRYFWPVSYALLFLLIALVVHAHRPRRAVLLLGLALTLQVADLRERCGAMQQTYRDALVAAEERLEGPEEENEE